MPHVTWQNELAKIIKRHKQSYRISTDETLSKTKCTLFVFLYTLNQKTIMHVIKNRLSQLLNFYQTEYLRSCGFLSWSLWHLTRGSFSLCCITLNFWLSYLKWHRKNLQVCLSYSIVFGWKPRDMRVSLLCHHGFCMSNGNNCDFVVLTCWCSIMAENHPTWHIGSLSDSGGWGVGPHY